MKKLFQFIFVLSFLITLLAIPSSRVLANNNLVSNPSVETVSSNSTLPMDWYQDSWGTLNASFSYLENGKDSNRSLRVDVSNYQNGDAKWYFKPVQVQAEKKYTYSTYYRASTTSEIVIQITDSSNNVSYQWLKTVPVNVVEWQRVSANFTAPQNADKVTVFHVVNSNGWLQTDDVFFGLSDDTPQPPSNGNLLPNASLETPDDNNDNKPAWWSSNNWGNNKAKFTYEENGNDGNRSVKTEVTEYSDGDAKWFVDPVQIKPSQKYTYRQFYKSNVETQVVAAYVDANGNYSYEWLKSAPVATNWAEMSVNFTTPVNSHRVSLYHVVDKVGWLQIDHASLVEFQVIPNEQPIPNPSLETVSATNSSKPENWSHNKWGSNTAHFKYLNNGHSGSRSVKVTVSNYVDGDAKWYFDPIDTLEPGKQYRFSVWYKSNIAPEAVAMFNKADGSTQYFGLPDPISTGNTTTWQQYTDTFTVPTDAVSTSVFLFINKNGWLQTDDYSITPYQPIGFNRPLVTLTFDDGHEDNVTNALPLLNQFGFKTTQCYTTQHVEGHPNEVQNVLAFFNSGHEICSHTVSHPFLTSLTPTQLKYELSHSKQVLESIINQPVTSFASPYGDYNSTVLAAIDDYYQSHRTVDEGYNSKDNFNVYRLRVQNIQNTTTLAEFQSWIDQARTTNTWLILVYHRVAPDAGQFDVYPDNFLAQLNAIKNSGITVKTYKDALSETLAQL